VHPVAFVELQVRVEAALYATDVGEAVKVAVGAIATLLVTVPDNQ